MVTISTKNEQEAVKMTRVQITQSTMNATSISLDESESEETPLTDRRKIKPAKSLLDEETVDSDSVESLKELTNSENLNNNKSSSILNNSLKPSEENSVNEISCKTDPELTENNLFRNSESEKEMDVKENFKKKKSRKKKIKKSAKKELPPIVTKIRRPLPQLSVVCEETEPANEN